MKLLKYCKYDFREQEMSASCGSRVLINMNNGVFPGQSTLTHSARTVAQLSLSARPLIMHGLRTATSRSQHRDASVWSKSVRIVG